MTSVYQRLVDHIGRHFPHIANVSEKLSPNLISDEVLSLPAAVSKQAQNIVQAFWQLHQNPQYHKFVSQKGPYNIAQSPRNAGALMSFDFHLNSEGLLKLIEINTNSSMALIAHLLYETHGLQNPYVTDFADDVFASFQDETRQAVGRELRKMIIVDDDPLTQKLYIEFLLYQAAFQKRGLTCKVQDVRQTLPADTDCVYNRHTDFYLAAPECAELKNVYLTKAMAVTPHPTEYQLLGDKERLFDIEQPGLLESLGLSSEAIGQIRTALLPSRRVQDFAPDPDALWAIRRKYFFKPLRSFGSKAVYRGSGITRSAFEKIIKADYIAQEIVPPPLHKMLSGEDYKYDLRFIVYQNRIQIAFARLYTGQVTGFPHPGGGIAPLQFN